MAFYVLLGIACALGVLAIIGTALLFLRETGEVQARAAETVVVTPELLSAPTVAEPVATEVPPPAVTRPPAARVARVPKRVVEKKEFRGTVWPPLEPKVEPVAKVEVAAEEPAEEPEPAAVTKAEEPEAALAPASEPAAVDGRSPSRMRRVFGGILRPFRGGRKPPAEQ